MRWMFRIIGLVALLALVAGGTLLAIPTERIAALVTEQLEQGIDRRVQISGSLRPTLYPYLGVRAEGVEVGNPDWVTEGPLLQAEALNVGINWRALLAGQIRLDRAELDSPRIVLVRDEAGRESWSTGSGSTSGSATPGADPGSELLAGFGFDRAAVRNASLRFIDRKAGRDLWAEEMDVTLTLPDAGATGGVSIQGVINGTPLDLEASIDGVASFLGGAVQPVALTLDWDGGSLSFDGRAGPTPVADGLLILTASDLEPLFALAGMEAPVLPQGLGRERLEISGNVTLTAEGSAHLRDGRLVLDDNSLAAALDLSQGADRPMIRGTISADRLDLSGMTGAAGGGGAEATVQDGWSRDPIDVSVLFAADAELAAGFGAVEIGGASLGPTRLRAMLSAGRLVLTLEQVEAFGGLTAGEVVVNGRGGLSMRADLTARAVALGALLDQLAGFDRLEGRGDIALQLLTSGDDMASLMRGLEGAGSITFGQGAILGFDLAGMIRNFDTSFRGEGQRTVYDSVTGGFTIAGGVLQNDDLLLDAPWGQVGGAGQADIGARTVDYRIIPRVMPGADGNGGLQVPILITGPWADLSFRPDLAWLAEQELAEERARLEAEAQERLDAERARLEQSLRDRANEALDIQIEEGQSREEIERTLEDRLREEAAERLRRLFD